MRRGRSPSFPPRPSGCGGGSEPGVHSHTHTHTYIPARVAGTMAEQESLEFGKADFVLLDAVTMPEFMGNLRLR